MAHKLTFIIMRYLLLSIIILSCCFSCQKYKAQQHFDRAVELEEIEAYREAIVELNSAINLDSTFTEAFINRAIDHAILENFSEAILDITKAIELEPTWIELYVVRAEYLRMTDQNDKALADLNHAVKLKFPDYHQGAKFNLLLDPEKDDFGYREAPLSYIYNERAWTYYAKDSILLAFDDINYSLEKRFNLPNGYYLRSLIFFSVDDRNQSCRDLKAAMMHGFTDSDERLLEYCAGWTDRGLLETFLEE